MRSKGGRLHHEKAILAPAEKRCCEDIQKVNDRMMLTIYFRNTGVHVRQVAAHQLSHARFIFYDKWPDVHNA